MTDTTNRMCDCGSQAVIAWHGQPLCARCYHEGGNAMGAVIKTETDDGPVYSLSR